MMPKTHDPRGTVDSGHRDPQLDTLLSRSSIAHNEFEAKTDILSLEDVLEALDEVRGLPPVKALTTLFGGTTGRVTLDQEQLTFHWITFRAICQLTR